MPLIALSVKMPENPFRLARKEMGILLDRVLDDNVHYFAKNLLGERFNPNNETRFRHDKRSKVYKTFIKKKGGVGQGKFVDLQLSGKSKRQALHLYKVTGKRRKKLKITVPPYYTKPFIGQWRDPQTGKIKRITRQPDKVHELLQVDQRDKDRLQKRANQAASVLGPKLLAEQVMRKARKKTIQGA
jgi:hypothetical protein